MTLTHTDPDGRQHFGPQLLTVARLSQYGKAWGFAEVEGFYNPPKDQPNMDLAVGSQYLVSWTSKPKPGGGNPYLDIKTAELPDGNIERFDPQGNMVPGPASYADAGPGRDTSDDDDYDDPFGPGKPRVDTPPPTFRDATRESIEKQVNVQELGRMLVAMHNKPNTVFTDEQLEWMVSEWFDGLYELKHGTPPPAATEGEPNEQP